MLFNWFECKVKFDKEDQDGIKSTNETYLVDAQSFTEAEARITLEMKPFICGSFEVANIKKVKIAEMFNQYDESADKWYKAKVNFVSIDEEKGIEKKVSGNMFIKGKDINQALAELSKGLNTSNENTEIVNIAETQIMDVFDYAEITTGNKPAENESAE